MTKIVIGGIVVVGIAVVSFVLAGAKQEKSPQPPGSVAVAAASDAGSRMKESLRATDTPTAKSPVSASSQPANAKSATTKPTNESGAKNVVAALQQAADAKKHLFVFVHEKDDEQMREGRKTFDTAVAKLGDAVQWIAINRSAPSENEFVEKYGLKAAPMPLVLSFAPNGAIVGGFVGPDSPSNNFLTLWPAQPCRHASRLSRTASLFSFVRRTARPSRTRRR